MSDAQEARRETAPALHPPVEIPHPSRNAPRCADCSHLTPGGLCNHPAQPVDTETGNPIVVAKYARRGDHYARGLIGDVSGLTCGPGARLFASRHVDAAAPDCADCAHAQPHLRAYPAGLLALLIALLTLLTACGGGGDDEPGPPDLRGINPPHCAASAPVCQ